MSINEAKNRIRLYLQNKEFCESRGYNLLPSKKEIQALNLINQKNINVNEI